MQTPPNICPQCQSPIPADAPGGLCPACVLLGVAGPTNPSQATAANAPTATEMKTEVEHATQSSAQLVVAAPPIAMKDVPWTRIFGALTALSGAGIFVSMLLDWRVPGPPHMLALTIVFATLTQVSRVSHSGAEPYAHGKQTWIAYFLFFPFGIVGGHKFYLGKIGMGIVYILTMGLFGIGLLIDLFTIPEQVRRANEELRWRDSSRPRRRRITH